MSTKKIWKTYNKLVKDHLDIKQFLLPLDYHYKYITAKENYEAFSRSLRVHLVKDITLSSSKPPKSHVKLVTHMHYKNGFELLIAVIFKMIPKIGGVGTKAEDLVVPFF